MKLNFLQKFSAILISCFLVVIIFTNHPLLSQTKQLSCELYAQEAVNALRTRLNNGCFPFQYSPRWQPFYANHYNWCLGASEGDKQKEIRIRNRELNNCQYSGCEAYASLAVDQNTHNQNLGCGFSGAAWQSNIRNHYDWCRNETPFSWIKNEALRRNDQLGSC